MFVGSDHATDKIQRASQMGFCIFINLALHHLVHKRQAMIKSMVFSSEFVALKQGMVMAQGLCYKLQIMGVPIAGPTYTYGDNMSVIHNTQCPESTLEIVQQYLLPWTI